MLTIARCRLDAYPLTHEDELWYSAFVLGRNGIEADPPKGLSYQEQTEWQNGYGWGAVQREEDLDETFARELDRAEREARICDEDDPYDEWSRS